MAREMGLAYLIWPVFELTVCAHLLLQDQMLTKAEVLDNWNMFVGSQATNYGEDLTRSHDEF